MSRSTRIRACTTRQRKTEKREQNTSAAASHVRPFLLVRAAHIYMTTHTAGFPTGARRGASLLYARSELHTRSSCPPSQHGTSCRILHCAAFSCLQSRCGVRVGRSVVLSPSCGLCAIKRAFFTAASDRYMSVVYTVPLMWTLRRGTVGFMIGGIARQRSPQLHNPLVCHFAIGWGAIIEGLIV